MSAEVNVVVVSLPVALISLIGVDHRSVDVRLFGLCRSLLD